MENKVISPCISICKTDPVTGYCYGCARTNDEKIIWKNLGKIFGIFFWAVQIPREFGGGNYKEKCTVEKTFCLVNFLSKILFGVWKHISWWWKIHFGYVCLFSTKIWRAKTKNDKNLVKNVKFGYFQIYRPFQDNCPPSNSNWVF